MAYMLEDKDMFKIPREEIGQVNSYLTILSLPFSMITTLFSSYIYELAGRKKLIVLSFAVTSLILFAMPYSAPNF